MEKQIEEILSGGYESPIKTIIEEAKTEIDNGVYKAVCQIGIRVDKDELLRALQYDRGQFEAGYRARDDEIVRCKKCVHYANGCCNHFGYHTYSPDVDEDDFCSYGERRANG